mmetsp:Transcript_23370/g.59693  ORF Transcript_23370/g.59693 Transcript_23370/m.59693 type:complete len:248 (-) Transcript_23370:626-1369(-)
MREQSREICWTALRAWALGPPPPGAVELAHLAAHDPRGALLRRLLVGRVVLDQVARHLLDELLGSLGLGTLLEGLLQALELRQRTVPHRQRLRVLLPLLLRFRGGCILRALRLRRGHQEEALKDAEQALGQQRGGAGSAGKLPQLRHGFGELLRHLAKLLARLLPLEERAVLLRRHHEALAARHAVCGQQPVLGPLRFEQLTKGPEARQCALALVPRPLRLRHTGGTVGAEHAEDVEPCEERGELHV